MPTETQTRSTPMATGLLRSLRAFGSNFGTWPFLFVPRFCPLAVMTTIIVSVMRRRLTSVRFDLRSSGPSRFTPTAITSIALGMPPWSYLMHCGNWVAGNIRAFALLLLPEVFSFFVGVRSRKQQQQQKIQSGNTRVAVERKGTVSLFISKFIASTAGQRTGRLRRSISHCVRNKRLRECRAVFFSPLNEQMLAAERWMHSELR